MLILKYPGNFLSLSLGVSHWDLICTLCRDLNEKKVWTTKVPDAVSHWCLGWHCSLETVVLDMNMLSGAIGGALASWISIKTVDLSWNKLSGVVLGLE